MIYFARFFVTYRSISPMRQRCYQEIQFDYDFGIKDHEYMPDTDLEWIAQLRFQMSYLQIRII